MAIGHNYCAPYYCEIEFDFDSLEMRLDNPSGIVSLPEKHKVLREYTLAELEQVKGKDIANYILHYAPSGSKSILVTSL